MTATGPRIANLMLDGIHDEDVVTAASRAAVGTMARAVRSLPVIGVGQVFDSGMVAFEVRNGGTDDMRVAFNVAPGPDLIYNGRPEARIIPPGASERVELSLVAKAPIGYADITPGRVVCRYQPATRRSG